PQTINPLQLNAPMSLASSRPISMSACAACRGQSHIHTHSHTHTHTNLAHSHSHIHSYPHPHSHSHSYPLPVAHPHALGSLQAPGLMSQKTLPASSLHFHPNPSIHPLSIHHPQAILRSDVHLPARDDAMSIESASLGSPNPFKIGTSPETSLTVERTPSELYGGSGPFFLTLGDIGAPFSSDLEAYEIGGYSASDMSSLAYGGAFPMNVPVMATAQAPTPMTTPTLTPTPTPATAATITPTAISVYSGDISDAPAAPIVSGSSSTRSSFLKKDLGFSTASEILSKLVHSTGRESIGSRRSQVKVACNHCKKACKRCDSNRPCSRCVRLDYTDCADAPRKERKRIKRSIKTPSMESLTSDIETASQYTTATATTDTRDTDSISMLSTSEFSEGESTYRSVSIKTRPSLTSICSMFEDPVSPPPIHMPLRDYAEPMDSMPQTPEEFDSLLMNPNQFESFFPEGGYRF
ncbi:uncharacterized protein BJ171DRAFT_489846, partial [Polychytrium aggregatum]|uniref:uncharacterized protein n=1 Tax=Polychytrium aggregatum TaxID=110093 RepID=UPI0022FDC1CF